MNLRTSALVMLFLAACSPTRAEGPKPEELEWLKKNAIPLKTCEAGHGFEDLQPLNALIGDARIVSLGECTHGTREVFQMKHRLVEYLASQKGFTIFAIEANMPEAYRLNEYVLQGKGDPKQLIAGMYFWTWNTEEVLAMVEWMRQFNQSGKGRIEFTGFDMQTPDIAMDIVLDFLKKHDPQRLKALEQTYNKLRNGKLYSWSGANFGLLGGSLPVEAVKGKRIRYSGWIKTAGVTRDSADLWLRADGDSGVLAFTNTQNLAIKGDTEWTEYALVLDIPEKTVHLGFGGTLSGNGKAWFDNLNVEIDGKKFDPAGLLDFTFEGDIPRNFVIGGEGYDVRLDDGVAKAGKKSLRMTFTGKADQSEADHNPEATSKECAEILAQLEASRDKYIKATSKKDADWAIQNARVVYQAVQAATGNVPRDQSMATNVKWILDQAPNNAKIILWAHNNHVGRLKSLDGDSMGTFLNQWYGKQEAVIGFAAGEGQYTAWVRKQGLRSDNPLKPPPSSSYEEYFRASSLPSFVLDLRKADKANKGSGWLMHPHSFRSIGAMANDGQFTSTDLPSLYDAIIYFDKTTASRSLPGADGKPLQK